MPFFFLYLYGNNNIMSEDLNKDLSKGGGLLRDMVKESGYLYDALTSIGINISTAIENAVDGANDLDDVGKKIANTYKKDIVNSIKSSARGMDKLVNLQVKINKGQNVSKQLDEAILKSEAKKETLKNRIAMIGLNGVGISEQELVNLNDTLDLETLSLKNLKDQNVLKQKGVSIYKITGDALGGMVDKLDKTGTLSGILKGNFKDVVTFSRVGQLAAVGLVKSLVVGVMMIDKLQTGFNKEFGLTDAHADSIKNRMADIANSSGKVSINFLDTTKALMSIGEETGILATGLRDDVLGGAAELQKLLGLSNKGMTMLAFNAQVTGQSMEEQTKSITKGVHQTEAKLGFQMREKDIIKEVSELTGLIRANLGRNVQAMGEAVSKAKAFGLTLQDLAGISSNLLDFQSSIEAELTAELFIGKELNLEKARLYALTGDYSKLQDEIVKNVGSEYEFLSMNVLAKQKYAAALGMSVDQMSNLVMKEADLVSLRRDATAAGDQDTLNMLNQRDLSQKMADIMTKIQTTFVDIAGGPIGALASTFSDMLSNTTLLYGILGLIAAVKIGGLISGIVSLGAAFGVAGVGALTLVSAATLGLGIAAVAAGIYYGTSVMNKEKKKASTVKRFNTLGATEMVSLDRGSAIFDQGESVVRTDNFAKLTDGINELIGVTQKQRLSFVVEGHHGTRYR